MSSDVPEIPETHAEKAAETARIRRRWLSLGETVAVIAVVISALTLWNNYDERKSAEAERRAAAAKQPMARAPKPRFTTSCTTSSRASFWAARSSFAGWYAAKAWRATLPPPASTNSGILSRRFLRA